VAKEFANSQDLVSIKNIRDNTLILKDGSYRQILMVQGVNFSLKSEEEQNMITQSYQNFLNSLEYSLQIIIHSRKINIQKYLNDLDKRMQEEPSPLLQNQISEYKEFVRKFVEENAIMEKTFLLVVPWYPPLAVKPSALPIPFLGKKKDLPQEEQENEAAFKENLLQLRERVTEITEGLAAIGLETLVLSDEQLLELLYNFHNPETVEKEGLPIEQQKNAGK
jgi:type IV secretory pathway VirB4 component